MFHFVIGLPGRFTQRCTDIAIACISSNGDQANAFTVNTPEEIARALLEANNRDTILVASSAGGRIRRALAEGGRPFLVAMDDPRRALFDLVVDMHMDFAAAVREIASACPPVLSYAQIECAVSVHGNDRFSHTAAKIASYLGGRFQDPTISAPLKCQEQRPLAEVQRWWNSLGAADRSLAEGAISAYLAQDATQSHSLRWEPRLFLGSDSAELGPMDITGRKRTLFEGPRIVVADGAWRLTLTMEFSRVAADYDYRLEVLAGDVLATLDFRPSRDGEQQSVVDFCVPDNTDYPLSIRLSLQRSAFDGTVTLKNAVLNARPLSA